jgi:hypothetical protein
MLGIDGEVTVDNVEAAGPDTVPQKTGQVFCTF